MYKQILILMVIILSLTSSLALTINSSDAVYINGNEVYFIVEVVNESNTGQNLEVNYFAPVPTQVIAPGYIAPNSKTTVKIFVKNDVIIPVDISTTLEIKTDKYLSKEILLKFNQQENTNQNNSLNDSQNQNVDAGAEITNNAAGFFALSLIESVEQISTESILLFLLILVIIVLLVAFVVRVAKRV